MYSKSCSLLAYPASVFNAQIFTMEQQEYEREGIDWTKIHFKDNQPCLDIIEKVMLQWWRNLSLPLREWVYYHS